MWGGLGFNNRRRWVINPSLVTLFIGRPAHFLLTNNNNELTKQCCYSNKAGKNVAGCVVHCKDGSQEMYDGCIMAVHAPDALRLLGDEATYDEQRILGAFQYVYR